MCDATKARSAGPRPLVFAAGGLLARDGPSGRRLAIVHRTVHRDWVLPKGKLDPGERFPDAALREVREETGCEVALGPFAGVDAYPVGTALKVVLYWHMRLVHDPGFTPGREIDAIAWPTVTEALRRLDHPGERDLVVSAGFTQRVDPEDS